MAIKRGKVVAVTSVKGGVGKTTTVLNLAGILSLNKKRTLIIDADLYNGGIAVSLDVECEKDIYTLTDDLANNRFDYIESYVKPYNKYIDILAAPKDPRDASKIQSKYLNLLLMKVRMRYDVILVDLNHIMDSNNLTILDAADYIYYCVTNDIVDIKGIKTMISIYKDMNKDNYRLILNESKDKLKELVSKSDMKNIIKNEINYIIPATFFLKNINAYTLKGTILTLDKGIQAKHGKAMETFEEIVTEILDTGDENGEKKASK
ncbi:MAG: AAA family ATPase [Bacilli bacterium]|nr:AAA family ATPase [Bacilli bacterium]